MHDKPAYTMQQPRKAKFSPPKRFIEHHFLERISTARERQNFREDMPCSAQGIRLLVL
jgi:hypothetical protein